MAKKAKKASKASKYNILKPVWAFYKRFWRKNWWHKVIVVICVFLGVSIGTMYGIARWYIYSQENQPYNLGLTFVPDYATYLGLDANQALHAMLTQLDITNIRFTSYWTDIEPTKGQYNFTELDQEFSMAQAAHVKVNLSIGLRQPRWPECHIPTWASSQPYSQWKPELMSYIQTVVNRYKNNPALGSYELENEYFLKAFGTCTNYSRTRLVEELALVKKLDPNHPVIISRSNNVVGTPIGKPTPDEFGVSVYKRVWDSYITHRYFEYPIPAWFYGFLAGTEKIVTGKNTIIHELQAEPWPPTSMLQASQAEQAKSMNASILKSRFQYGEATGIKTIDLWGAEWWYYEKVKFHNSSDWDVAKQEFKLAAEHNATLKAH
jgi:hypothetical protein